MLRDFRQAVQSHQVERADAIVIGAGVAGLLVATRLASRGIRTILLESGPHTQVSESDPLNAVVQLGQPYRGAETGRFRGLGGTSMRWGGAMLPFLPCDMEPHTAGWPVDWPVSLADLAPHFAELERLFRLPSGSFDVEREATADARQAAFILRSAKLPAFRLRNVAVALRKQIRSANLGIWVNATVTGFRLDDGGRLAAVMATSPSGAELTVEAGIMVVCAGAIESTRLLLVLDAQHGNRIFQPDSQLGRWFCDHLTAPAATILPLDRRALNAKFGMRFIRAGMRDLRIEPSPTLRRSLRLPGAFAHVTAHTEGENGFTALRALYLNRQSRLPLQARHAVAVGRDLGWLMRAAWWRFVKGRLLAPRGASFKLTLVIEQFPHPDNRITLATDRRDCYGVPLAQIAWRINTEDFNAFRTLQVALADYWQGRFATLGALELTPWESLQGLLQQDSDLFHPSGTTRMGRDASSGVVDSNLKTFCIDNLYVVSTSTFPSGGGANPTFMLMAFALRAADHVAERLASLNDPLHFILKRERKDVTYTLSP
jgi:choline dehydrogenase-like flavoprotein